MYINFTAFSSLFNSLICILMILCFLFSSSLACNSIFFTLYILLGKQLERGQKYNWAISCIHDFLKVCHNFWFLTYPKSYIMMSRQLGTIWWRVTCLHPLAHSEFFFVYNQALLAFSKISLIIWPVQQNQIFFFKSILITASIFN